VPGARPDLVQAGQQWLEAYQRRDRDAMATTSTDNITISDERSVNERFPAWQSSVRRDLDQVELELTGDTALLTSRMTERADGAQGGEHVSRVSQIWLRRNGRWRLADVRIIGEARLNQIIR
jgi:ketosteroid isomerase-like protein